MIPSPDYKHNDLEYKANREIHVDFAKKKEMIRKLNFILFLLHHF